MTSSERLAAWRPSASRHAIEMRANLLSTIRAFMAERDVMEVETPVLSASGNSDPNMESLALESDPKRYLRTSPEYAMKRMLAAGHGDIFELGRVFRAEERGRHHNPEFTLLEWYRTGLPYLDLAAEVVDLIRFCSAGSYDAWEVQWVSFRELFRRFTGLDPLHCSESELSTCAAERGIHAAALDQLQWLDLLFAEVVQPGLPGECLTVVFDFLPEQAALARVRQGDEPAAERFEVFLGQMELANGYQELTDADEQLRRFERENRLRTVRGEDVAPIDARLIDALRQGLPDCSGVALGVDRLLMSILKLERIDAVLAFDASRA